MIIDFRVRPPFKSFAKLRIYNPRPQNPDPVTASPLFTNIEPPYRSYEETSIDAFMEELDEAGIDVAVAMGRKAGGPHGSVPYEELVELRDLFPGRFVCFGGLNGVDVNGALEDIDRCVDLGFKGAALDNGWSEPPLYDDDERLYPIYEKCTERGLIVSLTSSIYVGPDVGYSMPVHIHRVAQKFPAQSLSQFPDLTIDCPTCAANGFLTGSCTAAATPSGLSDKGAFVQVFPLTAMTYATGALVAMQRLSPFQRPNVYLIPDIYLNVPGTDMFPTRLRRLLSCSQRLPELPVPVRQQLPRQASRTKCAFVQVSSL